MSFPALHAIPHELFAVEGNCGPIAAWMALRHFRKRVAVGRLIKLCRHTKKYGTFTVSIAVALRQCGLSPVFHTEEDSQMTRIEIASYRAASALNIPILPPPSFDQLRLLVQLGAFVIVVLDAEDGQGHFSPVTSISDQEIVFPYGNEERLPLPTFFTRWSAPGVLRQAVVVHG
jgi:hypothetical protein